MTKEVMSIHKALAELKIIGDRIERATVDATFCVTNKHSNQKINGVTIKEAENIITGNYDKVSDLIKRQKAIKRAVVQSNAVTKVTINDREYTIAEAIWMKNHGIDAEEELLANMKMQYNDAKATLLAMNGENLEKKAENYVIGLYGSKEGKTNTDDFDKAKKSFIEANTYDLIDPIKVLDKINSLEDYIANFKAEVDSALSCSNAITEITVEY